MGSERTALVFGATGLVGGYLVDELVKSSEYKSIKVFGRGSNRFEDPKIEFIQVDFDNLEPYSGSIQGDDLFICLGTTIRKAGSVAAMERIDRDYPVAVARIAARNGVRHLAVVSSMGANSSARNYYMRIKGEMEEQIASAGVPYTLIVRPSMLLGDRKEFRLGEQIGKGFMWLADPFLRGKGAAYRAVHGRKVARAMIRLIDQNEGVTICSSDVLQLNGD